MLDRIRHGDIVELRLNRPPVNALHPELLQNLQSAVQSAPGEGARAIVISGSPGMFSAGLDVPYLLNLDVDQMRAFWPIFYGVLRSLAASAVPVVAAITGHSPAGGAVLSLFCDRRIATAGEFRLGLNEVRVGLTMPDVIYRALVHVVGPRQAERLAVEGLMISPDEARLVGLVDEVVEPGDTIPRALAWCAAYLELPPVAASQTRRLARADLVSLFDEVGEDEVETLQARWFSEETRTTMQALVAQLASKKQ